MYILTWIVFTIKTFIPVRMALSPFMRLNRSYSLFRKRFLMLTGKSPGKFRTLEIMRRACTQLSETNDSLALIAEQLGFHDQFHFSQRFKKEIGISPSAFHRQVKRGN